MGCGHTGSAELVLATPFGPLAATCAGGSLRTIRFDWGGAERHPEPRAEPRDGPAPCPVLQAWRDQLERYERGDLAPFQLELDWEQVHGLRRAVLEATAGIPAGTVSTYGEIAADIGRPGEARAVGGALRSNPWVVVVPCHRVVAADGALTGYGGGPGRGGRLDVKAALLAHEGRPTQGSLFDVAATGPR